MRSTSPNQEDGNMALRTLIGAALAAGAASLTLAFAAPAAAGPTSVGCSPCDRGGSATAAEDEEPALPPWDALFAADPWGKAFDPDGDGKGAWENGVEAVNGGAWEKAFPPAE